MNDREQRVHKILKEVWYDVEDVVEESEDLFKAIIPRNFIHMNNLIELQGKMVWNNPVVSLWFMPDNRIRIELNFPS